MLFNSYIFILIFLPVTFLLYFYINKQGKYRLAQGILVVASFIFYGFYNWYYLIMMLGSILINYTIYYLLCRSIRNRKILAIGIAFNILVLFYYKYSNFFIDNINYLLEKNIMWEEILLPLGISFYTFQQIGFLVDVYRGEYTSEEVTLTDYAEFVCFFPQLIAGPIASSDLIIQLKDVTKRKINYNNLACGIVIFSVGLFKKVLLADTFSRVVNYGFSDITSLNSREAIVVMLSYTFQIFFDFSGYCDMAIGLGKLFNIDLPINFNSPYRSCSIIEFWERWHITLTRFLRKYIYIPLGGNRNGMIKTYINIFVVFLISGFWHGANWTFVVWGILHGIANILNRIFINGWNKLHFVIRWSVNFLLINVLWIIFRASSLLQAKEMICKVFSFEMMPISSDVKQLFSSIEFELVNINFAREYAIYFFLLMGFLLSVFSKPICTRKICPNLLNWMGSLFLLVWAVLSLAGRTEFIYFGF